MDRLEAPKADEPAVTPEPSEPVVDPGPAIPANRVACEGGAQNVEDPDTGNCYMYFEEPLPFLQAQAYCAGLQPLAALATIDGDSGAEVLRVNGIVKNLVPVAAADIWIGLSDSSIEGLFAWQPGNRNLVYSHWRIAEPNNGGGNIEEDCAVMEVDALGQWDDRSCATPYSFVCERSFVAAP